MAASLPKSINDLSRWGMDLTEATVFALRGVMQRGWFVLGGEVQAFESEFAQYLGVKHAVGVASGSDALLLALRAVEIDGGRVIVAANAGAYGTLAVLAAGGRPVFVDVEPQTGLMDLEAASAAIALGDIAAVIVTHLYGRMHAMGDFVKSAKSKGVAVIEDCAQAHGARHKGIAAGAVGDIGCFSFYPTKNLGALGDAGAVVTSNSAVAERLTCLRQYGWSEKYRIGLLGGMNSRMDEIQAAVLRLRLTQLERWNEERRGVARRYASDISNPRVVVPPVGESEYVVHLFVVRTSDRDSLLHHLRARGVPFDIHYPVPDHHQPALAPFFTECSLPETEAWAREVVSLPCFPGMRPEEVDAVVSAINAW
jgi:dTDP-3-amino-2,3,6-trideoxy-4-keto-D-glucose/dTDP-3-amino-3,4,6-trideoxy-alpha-D-glucose/dTDP-2,6-dideoxy-D-kanosamine transaminase